MRVHACVCVCMCMSTYTVSAHRVMKHCNDNDECGMNSCSEISNTL